MKRTPLPPRTSPLRRRTRLTRSAPARRPRSARALVAAASDRELLQAHKLVKERDRHCVLCDRPGVEVHHRLPRGAGGAMRDPACHVASRLIWLCRDHHWWAESHRAAAELQGVNVRHGIRPCSDVPLWHHGRWVLLDNHGCVLPTAAPVAPK